MIRTAAAERSAAAAARQGAAAALAGPIAAATAVRERFRAAGSRLLWLLLCAALLLAAAGAQAQMREGQALPAIDTELLDGRVLAADSLRGKVVVHMFWATWCIVCQAELPEMQRLHALLGPRGLRIVALSVDRQRAEAEAFWAAHGYGFPVAMRTPAMREAFGDLTGTPTFVVTGRDGLVRARRTGTFPPGELERLVRSLL
jgi:thiol-disulfide isomerase/thioredoxin